MIAYDQPAFPSVPDFVKSLDVERIIGDPEILVAYQMNGAPLSMLNGYPARLVVPGWYGDYWVKNLAQFLAVCRRSKVVYRGTSRHR